MCTGAGCQPLPAAAAPAGAAPSQRSLCSGGAAAAHLVQSVQRVVGADTQHAEEAVKVDLIGVCEAGVGGGGGGAQSGVG